MCALHLECLEKNENIFITQECKKMNVNQIMFKLTILPLIKKFEICFVQFYSKKYLG